MGGRDDDWCRADVDVAVGEDAEGGVVGQRSGGIGELRVRWKGYIVGVAQVLETSVSTFALMPSGKVEKTYGEDMHWRLDDDIKQLPLARLWVDCTVITALHTENDLQHVRHRDVAPFVLVRRVERLSRLRQLQVLANRPRAGTHEVGHHLAEVVARVNDVDER